MHKKRSLLLYKLTFLFIVGSVLLSNFYRPIRVFAMSELQRKVIKAGVLYANTEDNCAPTNASASTGTSSSANDSEGILGVRFPNFANEATVSAALTNFIKTREPTSPWLNVSQNIGEWIFAEAKTRDINPLLFASIGRQENGFGTENLVHVTQYYNYFGMKGSGPTVIPNSDYRGFSSPSEGLLFFMDKIKSNTQSSDRGNYAKVNNFYDYISVHHTGQIVYPGESLGPYNGGMDGLDETMGAYTSWTTTDHPNDIYDGSLFNPGIYYTNSIELINVITGQNFTSNATRGASGGLSTCLLRAGSTGGSGLLDSTGYSFPLAPQTKAVDGISEGQTTTTHSDETPAFDLFSTESADVYAIYDGVALVNSSFNDIEGCTAIEIYADDGFYYSFLHLKNPVVTDGSRVKAGQKIAQVADESFSEKCVGSAPHLHTDRGCVINGEPQRAGRDECRDPDYIPFLSAIYSRLPSN